MTRRVVKLSDRQLALDLVSYGRSGPKPNAPVFPSMTRRRGARAPEVMIKVSGGARTLHGVKRSLSYFARNGKLAMEGDTWEPLTGKGFQHDLVLDWDLDLEVLARQSSREIRVARRPPRLVYNVIFSMPPGTDPPKVLRAVKKFVGTEFGSKHRYGMVLHTDEPHPHVHLVLKARSEEGERLHIKKATLRHWREKFAENLRELGVAANATERAARGEPRARRREREYRAAPTTQSPSRGHELPPRAR
jgi:hypothetical protein